MAKGRIAISVEDAFKNEVERIGKWYLAQGVDVEDKLKGGVSLSATIRQLVIEKLREIETDFDNIPF